MLPGNTKTNVYDQAGDLLFALVSLARNQGWSLERLLQNDAEALVITTKLT